MDKELDKYYSDRFDMMASQGWKDLLVDVEEMIKSTSDISAIYDADTLNFNKGQLKILWYIKSLKEITDMTYEEAK